MAESRVFSMITKDEDETDEDDFHWKEIQTHHDSSAVFPFASFSKIRCLESTRIAAGENFPPTSNEPPTESNSKHVIVSTLNTDQNGPSRMSLNDHKAGMEGLDKEKINKIIYESSKGSRFYENELKREKQVNERIKRQSEKLGACSEHELAEAMVEADRVVQELESGRDMSRTIVHVDMDAFYAAVEMRDDPSLKDKPMAVGSTSMLSTSNYPARRYGVRAAMPGFIAKKLCPHLIIVPLHFDKYRAVSKIVRGIFREYDPRFVPMSLDEAYLDLTDYLIERQRKTEKRLFYKKVYRQTSPSAGVPSESESSEACGSNTAQESENVPSVAESVGEPIEFGNDVKDVVQEIRFRIENETQLTASAGIACNVLLAKVCTDCNKPNGQFYLKPDREEIVSFVKTLPIRKISGIGRVSEQMLKALGVITCADLFEKRDLLVLLHSDISSRFLIEVALGLGATRLETDRGRKSLGTERTFSEISNPAQLFSECEQLCKAIAVDMNEEGLRPKTVTIKLKTINFELKTRSVSFRQGITSEKELIASAFDLLGKEIKACEPKPLKLRLMGVRLSNFINAKSAQSDAITNFFSKKETNTEEKGYNEMLFTSGADNPCRSLGNEECSWLPSMPQESDTVQIKKRELNCEDSFDPTDGELKGIEFEKSQIFTATCPVCSRLLSYSKQDYLIDFNKHVDMCLNTTAIQEALSEEQQRSVNESTRHTSSKISPTKYKAGKRRSQGKVGSQPKKRTMETFWSK